MEIVDSKGNFTLIRNGQVKIDKSLPKHKRISEFLNKNEDYKKTNKPENSVISYNDLYRQSHNDDISDFLVTPDEVEGDSMSSRGRGIGLEDLVSLEEVFSTDHIIHTTISGISKEELDKCITEDNAFEFNKKFAYLLGSEVLNNHNVLSISSTSMISYSDDPVPMTDNSYMSFLDKMKFLFSKNNSVETYQKKKRSKEDKHLVNSLISFMDTIHIEIGKGKQVYNKLDALFSMMDGAVKMHQSAQLDEIAKNIIVNIYECILSAHGYDRYISFGDIEKIDCPGKRLIDIDYISNFGRVIPDDIVNKKLRCDEFGIFDNYCVMYYDPSGKTYKVPESTKRDPILFGLINHSNKLYYIADWVDDNCDLTLDKIAEITTIRNLEK